MLPNGKEQTFLLRLQRRHRHPTTVFPDGSEKFLSVWVNFSNGSFFYSKRHYHNSVHDETAMSGWQRKEINSAYFRWLLSRTPKSTTTTKPTEEVPQPSCPIGCPSSCFSVFSVSWSDAMELSKLRKVGKFCYQTVFFSCFRLLHVLERRKKRKCSNVGIRKYLALQSMHLGREWKKKSGESQINYRIISLGQRILFDFLLSAPGEVGTSPDWHASTRWLINQIVIDFDKGNEKKVFFGLRLGWIYVYYVIQHRCFDCLG